MNTRPEGPSYHPIIYVRGFAATQGEIEDTVADPYMGFNIGSTKARRAWNGELHRFFFESPLVRLMAEHGYDDVYVDGEDLLTLDTAINPLDSRCIIIYRYYDDASEDFGTGDTPPIEQFAKGLSALILRLREKVCANKKNKVTEASFRVHLVAHSMGGLVCRAFLQNAKLGTAEARKAVDKVFTYATPHNGIDMRIVRNVPGWLSFGDVNNFNRGRMAEFLALPKKSDDVSLVKEFPAERIFNLVGTNSKDYSVMRGLSAWAAGEASDGLVRVENALTHGPDPRGNDVFSPSAYVHRSHSGHYGIVNSEEGYQNLVRFLFGRVRIDGFLEFESVTLPADLEKIAHGDKSKVKASYQTEVSVSVRGCQWQITRREVRENSAIFRTYDQLFPKVAGVRQADPAQSPHLFSVFLDPEKSLSTAGSVSFACDIKLIVPDYQVDGALMLKRHYEGGYLFRELILVEAFPRKLPDARKIKYGFQTLSPNVANQTAEVIEQGGVETFRIALEQKTTPGFKGSLRVELRPWA